MQLDLKIGAWGVCGHLAHGHIKHGERVVKFVTKCDPMVFLISCLIVAKGKDVSTSGIEFHKHGRWLK